MQESKEDRSLGELFGELAREMSTLVSQEVQLARTEITEKASRVGKDIGLLLAGGAVAYAGFLAIMAAVIMLLAANGLPMWVSALLVGLVIGGVGYVLVQRGLAALKREDLTPRQSIESIREDAQWAKEQIR
jgi:hypothetical protein